MPLSTDDGDSDSERAPRNPRDDDDAAAFADAVRGARRLPGPPRVSITPRPIDHGAAPAATRGPRPQPLSAASSSAAPRPIAPLSADEAGDSWFARADGVDRRIIRKLRGGDIPIEGRLDLHGLTRAKAERAIDGFLVSALASRRRCLLVIHGRGLHSGPEGPVLRDVVHAALTTGPRASAVLACCAAPASAGRTGATLVLLRR